MTPTQLRSILKALGLPPHSKRTEMALGIGRRQIANYLAGKKISKATVRILELETEKHGERKDRDKLRRLIEAGKIKIISTYRFSEKMKMRKEKAEDAYERASRWLNRGNEASERGDKESAERCFNCAQLWLDRANKWAGNS